MIFLFQSENRILLSKLINKYPPEIDASVLRQILRGHWKAYLLEKPTLELCKSLGKEFFAEIWLCRNVD